MTDSVVVDCLSPRRAVLLPLGSRWLEQVELLRNSAMNWPDKAGDIPGVGTRFIIRR